MAVGRGHAWLKAWLYRARVGALGALLGISSLALAGAPALVAKEATDPETVEASVRVRAAETAESTDVADDEPDTMVEVAAREVPAATAPEPAAEPEPPLGESITGYALQFTGYPYAWAGNTPAGFDCSGFTQFVILNTVGVDIGHGLGGQPGMGAWVNYGAWLPGDLVFFQNTYQAGLSHAGIYIGDGLFIHAENEGTGVVISSMYSDYYGPRYWGAVRVG